MSADQTDAGVVILGAGGHAALALDCLEASGFAGQPVLVDPDESLWGSEVLGAPVKGGEDLLPRLRDEGARFFLVGVGATQKAGLRRGLYELGLKQGLEPLTIIHPRAVVSPHAALGPGCQVLAGVIINPRAELMANVLLNSGAVIEHDCQVGEQVHIGSGAVVLGGCRIGPEAMVGAGAVLRQGVTVGADAVVGAGAVVVKDVPPGARVAGNPAAPLA